MRKWLFLSLLTSAALVLTLIETSLPIPIAIPGARLGLSNIIILSAVVVFGFKEGLVIGTLKSMLMILLTGSVMSFFYSFFGAIASTIAMFLTYKYIRSLSLIGVSFIGAFFHNLAQVLVASFILNNLRIFIYLPLLLLLSVVTGYFVGLASKYTTKQLKRVWNESNRSYRNGRKFK